MTHPKRLSQEAGPSLVARLRARDESALSELYDQVAPWLLGVAFRVLHDEDEAEDVVADVIERVWTRIGQHDAQRGLMPWLLSITRNRAVDLLRRRQRWWRKADRWERARAAEGGDAIPAPSPHDAAVPGWPLHREVHQALAALPEEQRRVVALAYFEGLSHSEIARRLAVPLGTVKTRLRMAQGKLRETLAHVKDWLR